MATVDAGKFYENTIDALDEPLTQGRKYMPLYEAGMTDTEIALEVHGDGRAGQTVRKWRKNCNLPENAAKDHTPAKKKKASVAKAETKAEPSTGNAREDKLDRIAQVATVAFQVAELTTHERELVGVIADFIRKEGSIV